LSTLLEERLRLSLHFLDDENLVLVEFLMQRELAGLPKGLGAPLIWAFEGLLTCVDVHVLLEVLSKGEGFPAPQAIVLFGRSVRGLVASQGEPRRECLVAACISLTSVWLLHSLFFEVVIVLGE
jgi:hypothetical protein